jgi:hypothetical protein
MPPIDRATLDRWRTLAIVDRDGGTVGSIVEFYLDRETGRPTWALVNTGLFGSRHTFVPLLHATEISDGLRVPYEKGHIKDAPRVDATDELSPEEETALLGHYGIDDSPGGEPAPADPGLAEPPAAAADPEATTAHERPAGGPEAVAAGPGPVPAADVTTWPPSPPPPGRIGEPPVELAAEPRAEGTAEPPRAPGDATVPGEEPSMLERAKRRLEGLVSGTDPATPAEREAAGADRHGEQPDVDRDRR